MSAHRSSAGSRIGTLALLALLSSACVGAHYVPSAGQAYPPREKDCEIAVYSTQLPEREYEEIGFVEGEGSHWKSDLGDLLPKLKEQACLAGGDAIVLEYQEKYIAGHDDPYPVLHSVATVLRWSR